MKETIDLAAAPTGMQPGGYVPVAYGLRIQPFTPKADMEVEPAAGGWRVRLSWECPEPARDLRGDTDRFVDAAAVLAPTAMEANWVTMGAPGLAVEAALWRADRDAPLRIRAEGLGTVKRNLAPDTWKAAGEWEDGRWRVAFELHDWPALEKQGRFTFAIWRGAACDRGGLKSICPRWIELPR